jgi:hypothetical protein
MLIRLVLCVGCVAISACAEQRHHFYPNGTAALSGDEARGQWVPTWLPPSATDVHLQYDVDTNARWIRFILPTDQRAAFLSHLRAMRESEVSSLRIRSPRSADWWFDGIIDQQPANDGALNAEWFVEKGARSHQGSSWLSSAERFERLCSFRQLDAALQPRAPRVLTH